MPLLDLDTTINKYLGIINKNILEPYLTRTDWAAIEGTPDYKDTVDATFDSGANKIMSGTGADDVLKTTFTDGAEAGDYFKINQESGDKAAAITKSLDDSIDGSTDEQHINSAYLTNNFYTDIDGLIYYTTNTNGKLYNFNADDYFSGTSIDSANISSFNNHTYYDYFVRFKVLKYIKDLDAVPDNLREDIKNKLSAGTIADIDQVTIDEAALISNILHFLEFINIKNNDKFEATVNCLYYYYYIALLEYNTIFCSRNLEYFSKNNTIIDAELTKLKPSETNGASNYEYKVSDDKDLILSSLIAIFESLIGADNDADGTFATSLITNIFIRNKANSKVYELIRKLLKLHYDASYTDAKSRSIKLFHISSSGAANSAVFQIADSAKNTNDPATPTELTASYQLRLRCHVNEVITGRSSAVNANIAYTGGSNTNYFLTTDQQREIESIPVGVNIKEFITAYTNTLSADESIVTYSSAIDDIRELYDLLTDLSSTGTELYTKALVRDGNENKITGKNSVILTSGDYVETKIRLLDANTKLAAIKPVLGKILEHYEKAKKLNEIQGYINNAYDSIKATTENTTIQDENNEINKTLVNITKADNSYKENVDKYKTKNNELNNILKNNLYNNIFLYITIVVLILICLGLIYINNHKASLKTQYSIMLIAFLLLYYIIYTNVTVNITEPFETPPVLKPRKTKQEFETLSTAVHIYLYSLTTKSKAYKESLKTEKHKYDGFAKSSNSKLNSLELVLNDEFINAIKSKELVKFLILFTAICIISYIVYTNTEDPTTTSIIFIILFVIILAIYFYNINLMTRTKADNKYWNHQMVMK